MLATIPRFVPFDQLPRGTPLRAGMGTATVMADLDFETYSDAGYVWNETTRKWCALPGAPGNKKGLGIVGAATYAEHPSTCVLSLAYDLKDGRGQRYWVPGMPNPQELFDFLAAGNLIEAWNVGFEYWIWEKVCTRLYGWPPLPVPQLRCAMAKARAFALPGKLEKAGAVLKLAQQKDKEGDRLLKKFSMPRNPTAKDQRRRIPLEFSSGTVADMQDSVGMVRYNLQDIVAEAHASASVPDLEGEELQFWQLDQKINRRGVQIDVEGVHNCVAVLDQALEKYNTELWHLTGGQVARASELAKLKAWLATQGVYADKMDEDALDAMLEADDQARKAWASYCTPGPFYGDPKLYEKACKALTPAARRGIEIRAKVGSASVKKVYAMRNRASAAGRLHDLFNYYAARTGRTTGEGPQPTNLPKAGPNVVACECGRHYGGHLQACPWCSRPRLASVKPGKWNPDAANDALEVMKSRSLEVVEYYFGDALGAISGCLRGLFIAKPGYDLISSDYSAIEAVVLAMISGEQWRIDVFRTHGKIYEMSVAKITGIPFNDLMKHAGYTDEELAAPDWYKRKPARKGSHHPMRQTIGKVAELASGYQGWIGAWKAFGAEEFMTEEEMKRAILAWRDASPAIVEFWGGQSRRMGYGHTVPHLYGVEGMFIAALNNPGVEYDFRGFKFIYRDDCLYLRLLSGRYLHYHQPRLRPNTERGGMSVSYWGNNTNPKNGAVGWIQMDTWGGRITENIVQAVARDIQWHGMLHLENAGYPIVLHVYDEDAAEIPQGVGSIQQFERLMSTMPRWAHDWPVAANGGWRGLRYRKED